MDIFTYFFFSYGLTAVIALATIGIIVLANKCMQAMQGLGKDSQRSHNM